MNKLNLYIILKSRGWKNKPWHQLQKEVSGVCTYKLIYVLDIENVLNILNGFLEINIIIKRKPIKFFKINNKCF